VGEGKLTIFSKGQNGQGGEGACIRRKRSDKSGLEEISATVKTPVDCLGSTVEMNHVKGLGGVYDTRKGK